MGINKRLVESLIRCGAFDSLGVRRSQLIAVYEKVLESVMQEKAECRGPGFLVQQWNPHRTRLIICWICLT